MERFARGVAVLMGVFFVAFGVWAFVAPASFFEIGAAFEPYNRHFVRDIGAFQLGLGSVLLLSTRLDAPLTIALGGVGIGWTVHAVGHVVDRELGGEPATDIPFFVVTVLLLLGAAFAAHRSARA